MNWMGLVNYALDRFKEPSTYAGIAGIALAAGHALSPDVTVQLTGLGIAIASTLAVVIKEKKA